MVLLISFLIGLQVLDALAVSPPLQFVYPPCSSLEVKAAADAAINELNARRNEGYVLRLQRIFNVHEDQEIRSLPSTVYGQCKIIIELNRNSDDWHLLSYDCSFQPVSGSAIVDVCPDCPIPLDPSEDIYQQTALETLAKFNAENEDNNYFAILNVTKAYSLWVVGPSNHVEYTIQETSCPKNPPFSDITQCPFLPTETAAKCLCRGSVVENQIENKKNVYVKCKLFQHLPPVTDEQMPQPTSEPQEPQHPHPSPNIREASPKQKETVGRVIYHNPWSKHAIPEVQEPNPTSCPTLASPGQDASPQLAKPA
ncbi:PREDICTED: fetuin-B-like, partial [Thamnophis sirtalis]|uniref:Fetuin-B-like n=1 Tax=Thamnophis sirtalis TaxID=35019 RepID=A0A6I9Z1G2_9SAUR